MLQFSSTSWWFWVGERVKWSLHQQRIFFSHNFRLYSRYGNSQLFSVPHHFMGRVPSGGSFLCRILHFAPYFLLFLTACLPSSNILLCPRSPASPSLAPALHTFARGPLCSQGWKTKSPFLFTILVGGASSNLFRMVSSVFSPNPLFSPGFSGSFLPISVPIGFVVAAAGQQGALCWDLCCVSSAYNSQVAVSRPLSNAEEGDLTIITSKSPHEYVF